VTRPVARPVPPRGARWLVLAALPALALGVAAWAQNIRIPELRERPEATAVHPKAGEPCDRCGVISAIKEVSIRRPVNVPPEMQSNPGYSGPGGETPVGAVVYLPYGAGTGKSYAGGVGTPEMRQRFSATEYEITIRLDSGGYTMVRRRDGLAYRVGDRVRVQGIQLELLVP